MPLLGSVSGVLWGSWAKVGLVNSSQKSRVSVSPLEVLSKGCIRHTGAGKQGRLLITGLLGKIHQGLTLACDLVGCYTGRAPAWG